QTMALTQRLQIRQSQALVMTPQLMQAIKLLQLSHLDLAAYVETELERNPLLERGTDEESAPEREAAPAPDEAGPERDTGAEEPGFGGGAADDGLADDPDPARARTPEGPAGYSEWAGVG